MRCGAGWTRILATVGAAVALTLSLGAASSGRASDAREGGTFRVVDAGLLKSIDPALISVEPEVVILRASCGGLLSFPHKPLPEGLRVVPELAESLPAVSNGGKTYRFTIRKDARFSSGERVTAVHFSRALERILNPALRAPLAEDFAAVVVGARAVLDGKTTKVAGAVARGRTLILRLTRPVPEFPHLLPQNLCAVPAKLSADPEGAKAPLHSPAPYYVSEFVPGRRVVLARNRFYRGPRTRHVDRFVVRIGADLGSLVDMVASGEVDYALGPPFVLAERAAELAARHGVNRSRFWVTPAPGVRMFTLNTSRPLFRNNVKLRQAVNFAVDRKALIRELGPYAGTASDQFLPSILPGFRDERIYPLTGPDLRRARALAAGRTRSGKAVLYTLNHPTDLAQAEILRRNLKEIGIELEVQPFPTPPLLFGRLATSGEPFDIGRVTWEVTEVGFLSFLFDGRSIGPQGANWSYFNSTKYNRLLQRAANLPIGPERSRAYAELDVRLSRDAAPAVPYGAPTRLTFVSARTGCVVVNPLLDLTAVCLK